MESSNPDIRGQVDASRGILKKIQLVIPGFRGYRQLEDLRQADELLRKQVASYLQQAEAALQDFRSNLALQQDFSDLTTIASTLSRMQQFEGELLHSQQGYSGFVATIKIDQTKLNDLYQYDYSFLDAASTLLQASTDLSSLSDPESIRKKLSDLTASIQKTKNLWEQRMVTVEKIKLNPGSEK